MGLEPCPVPFTEPCSVSVTGQTALWAFHFNYGVKGVLESARSVYPIKFFTTHPFLQGI